MTNKTTESSSAFVVVSRRTLIVSVLGAALLSFAAGYFLGYEGSPSDKLIRKVDADNKTVVSEEKTVLDSSGKPNVVDPGATPGAIPKELIPRPAGQNRTAQKSTESQPKSVSPAIQDAVKKDVKIDTVPAENKDGAARAQAGQTRSEKKTEQKQAAGRIEIKKTPEKKAQVADIKKKAAAKKPQAATKKKPVKKAKEKRKQKTVGAKKSERLYSVQVGSFLDPQKATRLKEDLQGRGFTAHIVTGSNARGKTYSKVRIGAYRIKTDAEELFPKLKKMGLECVIAPTHK
jgi:cell division protein FtsN